MRAPVVARLELGNVARTRGPRTVTVALPPCAGVFHAASIFLRWAQAVPTMGAAVVGGAEGSPELINVFPDISFSWHAPAAG